MAPTKTVRNKSSSSKGSKNPRSVLGANTKSRVSKKPGRKAPPPKQQKTKSKAGPVKKKRRVYTDKELGVPKLNMITPVGVDLPKGKKKGKVFVDDQVSLMDSGIHLPSCSIALADGSQIKESMMTILAIVNASKEGQIESKMMKSRKMEEIREARQKEAEARQEQRKSKLVRSSRCVY